MSNPAVVKLQKGTVNHSKVWLDDNFGESIHIHIDDFRIDLTTNEFSQLHEDLCYVINNLLQIENFDVSKIDPVYLSLWLWPNLSKITHVKIENVYLEDMLARHPDSYRVTRINKSVGVRSLQGLSNEGNRYTRRSSKTGESDSDRMLNALNSIKENGYPYNDQFIILFGDDNLIRDGQHRASCLYYLYGNISVPVLRIYLKGYKPFKFYRGYNSFLVIQLRKIARLLMTFTKSIKNLFMLKLKKIKKKLGMLTIVQKRHEFVSIDNEVKVIFYMK